MGEKKLIRSLFERYRKGTATAEEQAQIAAWLQQLDVSDTPGLSDEEVEHYATRSRDALRRQLTPAPKVRRISTWLPWAAACAVAALLINLFFQHRNIKTNDATLMALHGISDSTVLWLDHNLPVVLDDHSDTLITLPGGNRIRVETNKIYYEGNAVSTALHTLCTGPGKRLQVVLPDSSRIWLNGRTALTYPASFSKKVRQALVVGEAYFEISKAAEWPFIVNTPNNPFRVEVLGTAFNITARPGEKEIAATLVSGSVQLGIGASNTLLKPSQRAVYSLNNKNVKITVVNTERATDWVHNRLVFRDTPMKEVLEQLAKFYNVSFDVKNKNIWQQTFTGVFENKSLETVLDYMKISSKIQYVIRYKQEGRVKKQLIELK